MTVDSTGPLEVEPYIPQFLWRFWLSDAYVSRSSPRNYSAFSFFLYCRDPHKRTLDDHRVHVYDIFNNVLSETRRIPEQTQTVFHDFVTDALDEGCRDALRTAEQAFTRLENDVERILAQLVLQIRVRAHLDAGSDSDTEAEAELKSKSERCTRRFELPMSKREREMVLRYFVFLRYRNSEAYKDTVGRLTRRVVIGERIVQARHAWHRVRRRAVLGCFHAFLRGHGGRAAMTTKHRFEGFDCWRFLEAEICFGVASEEQQFVLPDTCFASLDEDFGGDPWVVIRFLFPNDHTLVDVTPLYI